MDFHAVDKWWYSEICPCSRCKQVRRLKSETETATVSKLALQNMLADIFDVEKVTDSIRRAIIDRYWEDKLLSINLTAMLDLAARVNKGEVMYDEKQDRFYTINRLYI